MESVSSFRSVLVFLILLNLLQWMMVRSQSIPPARSDGFVYQDLRVKSDSIVVEAFFDPVCPDSRDSWPPLKLALEHYGSRVLVIVHLLPLPYHDNAFAVSRALHIVNSLTTGTDATFQLLEHIFKYQAKFYNGATRNLSRVDVVNEIIKFAAEATGNLNYAAIESGFSDRKTDLLTRISFKYSASRGVSATPTFYVNGFSLPNAGSPIDYNGWRSFIDPLVGAKRYSFGDFLHLYYL